MHQGGLRGWVAIFLPITHEKNKVAILYGPILAGRGHLVEELLDPDARTGLLQRLPFSWPCRGNYMAI